MNGTDTLFLSRAPMPARRHNDRRSAASGEPDDHSTVTSRPLVGCSGLLGRSQEHGLALALTLTLDVPQPLQKPHDSYCVVISE